jgi:hypothetical protein
VLAKYYSKKLKLQEDRFTKKRGELQDEISRFKKQLKEAEAGWKVTLTAKADTEGELASLQAQVGGISEVVEKAKDEASWAWGLQHERAKMFRAL